MLAFACAFTMFAGAAFTDQADIETADAVDTLVALGVIDGYEDGTFRPDDTVTRAEMAKMIYIIRTNRSDASAYNDDATSFTDINNHWARGYIKYCQSLGVISGKSVTIFDPDATVTTQEAAKMLLVTLGYDANKAGLEGSGWGQKTTALADENGLLEDVVCGTTQGMPRQYAAQLIYNAIFAATVQWRDDEYYNANILGDKYPTIGAKYMDLTLLEGILYSSGKFSAGIQYDNTTGAEEAAGAAVGDKYLGLAVNTVNQTELATANRYSITLKYDKDLTALVGETVKVLVGKNNEVYGVSSSSEKNTVITTTTDVVKDWTSDSVKIDGVKYDIESDFIGKASIDNKFADQVKFVDFDGNDDLDLAIVVPVGVAKVTFVGSDSVTLSKTEEGSANLKAATQKLADVIAYDGIAKDDYVVFQKDLYTQKDMLVKADVLEGTVTGVKAANNEWQINGSWYKLANDAADYNGYTPAANDVVKAVALGSKLYFIEKTSGPASAEDVAMVVTHIAATAVEKDKAVLLLADGTKVTKEYKMAAGSNIAVGGLFTYTIDNDDVYELTEADDMTDYTWVDGTAGDVDLVKDEMGNPTKYSIADDAVVFLINNTANALASNEAKVITGKELKSMTTGADSGKIATQSLGFYYSKNNGINKATIIAVKAAVNESLDNVIGSSSANYGYLVDDAYTSKGDDGKDYINFKLWNGSETVEVKWQKSGTANTYTKHDVIGYDDLGDGLIGNVDEIGLTKAALTGGAGTDDVQFDNGGALYSIESDTVILYVNGSADDAADIGVAGGSIENAMEPSSGVFVQNVKYKANNVSKELEVLVVDVNNKLADRTTNTMTIAGSGDVKVYVNDEEVTTTANIAAGDIVKFVGGTTGGTVTPNTANIIGNLSNSAHTVAANATESYVVQSATAVTLTLA